MLLYKQNQGIIEVHQTREIRFQKISFCSGERVSEIPSIGFSTYHSKNKGRVN